jgi:amidase
VAVKEAETGRRREGSAYVPHGLTSPIRGAEGGVLTGLTAVVKDVFDIAGERTGAGSPEWLADAGISHATAPAVQQMLDAGAAVVAKTVCDELMFSITGSNAHYGTPLNPRVPDRLPGGSSSGSASATASGACDIALGTDTAGSVRVPAALCGVFGLRTTHGRVSMAGVVPMAPSFDSVGWFAPTAGLLRLAGGALLGSGARRAEVVRIRLATDLIAAADGHVAAAAQDFVARAAGDLVVDNIDIVEGSVEEWVRCFRAIQGFETWQSFGRWITARTPGLGPGIAERMRFASTVTEPEADGARARRVAIAARLHEVIDVGTVVAFPTVPCPAPRLDADTATLELYRSRTMAFTCVAGLGGLPQVSLPLGLVRGAPAAVSLLGWRGGDEALLDLASTVAVHCAV